MEQLKGLRTPVISRSDARSFMSEDMSEDALQLSPDGVRWRREGGKDVSRWHYLGTEEIQGHKVEFRARLHRYGDPGAWEYIPLVQYRADYADTWSDGFEQRNLRPVTVRAMIAKAISTVDRVLE
jgi:hypothetical protein